MGPEDCINLMRPRDVNFRDIKAFEKMFKKTVWQKCSSIKDEGCIERCGQRLKIMKSISLRRQSFLRGRKKMVQLKSSKLVSPSPQTNYRVKINEIWKFFHIFLHFI